MKILSLDDLTSTQYRRLIHRRVDYDDATRASVASICADVRDGGDEALQRFTEAFDGVTVSCLRVDAREIATARASLDLDELDALQTAADHIAKFHAAQNVIELPIETVDGVRCWRERRPIGAVGLYVPAGSAPLPSTVLMLGVPARIAGCARIALCSPPDAFGRVNRYVLAAAAVVGIDEVYCVGGAQAIAGLAYGTESIERVDKIFGPGNRFVAAAKQFVVGAGVAIDLVAGPSELLVIADETANAALVAADLLSQAEHDRDACVVLVTTSRSLAESTVLEIERQFKRLDRAEITRVVIDNGCVLVVDSLATALRVANDYAPEHLQLNIRDPETAARDVAAAGSVFLGQWAPVTAGDYASGTNHTLPTGGAARAWSGLGLEAFQTSITFQSITKRGLENLAPTLVTLARIEGLDAHARAVTARVGISTEVLA